MVNTGVFHNFIGSIGGNTKTIDPNMSVQDALGNFSFLYAWGWKAIFVIFVCSVIYEIFKAVTGQQSNYMTIIIKFLFIGALYNYSGTAINYVVSDIVSYSINEREKDQVYDALNKYFDAFKTSQTDAVEKAADKNGEEDSSWSKFANITESLMDAISYFAVKSFTVLIMLIFLAIAIIAKFIMLDIVWPFVYQLTLIGFIFSVVFASLPGGSTALKKFFTTLIEVALWPIIYSMAFTVVSDDMAKTMLNFTKIINHETINSVTFWETVLLNNLKMVFSIVGYGIYLSLIAFLTPKLASMIVRSDSAAAVGAMAGFAIGTAMSKVGTAAALGGGVVGGAFASSMLSGGSSLTQSAGATLNKLGASIGDAASSAGSPAGAAAGAGISAMGSVANSASGAMSKGADAMGTLSKASGSALLRKMGVSENSVRTGGGGSGSSASTGSSGGSSGASTGGGSGGGHDRGVRNMKGLSKEESMGYKSAVGGSSAASADDKKQMKDLYSASVNPKHSDEKRAEYKSQLNDKINSTLNQK